ncbi:hypothetical protein [Paraclostridium bifermentans]
MSFNDIGNVKDSGNSTNTNVNNNKNDIKTLFENIKREIEDNGSLIEVVIDKINEIEYVSQEDVSRSKKWSKLKSIINWVTTKDVDIGVKIYTLIMSTIENNE